MKHRDTAKAVVTRLGGSNYRLIQSLPISYFHLLNFDWSIAVALIDADDIFAGTKAE